MEEESYCLVCACKLFRTVDADPNGEMSAKCARCVAEEYHDYAREPGVVFNRFGQRVDPRYFTGT